MERKCLLTGSPFTITDMEIDYCERYGVPLPLLSPRERLRELAVRRNRVHLFNSTCAGTGKRILSMIPPDSGFSAYDCSLWYSDDWDALQYGRDYDFDRPFFEQWYDLARAVPLPNLAVVYSTLENSDYTNGIQGAKNCYLLFASNYNEGCLFSISLNRCNTVFDSVHCTDCELCHECTDAQGCYELHYGEHCANCSESDFLSNCIGCRHCVGCVNLSHAEYCLFNEQLTKSDYERRRSELHLETSAGVESTRRAFEQLKLRYPVRAYFGLRNQSSTGNYLNNTKGCAESFFVTESEDMLYALRLLKGKNSIAQLGYGIGSELVYNSATVGEDSYNIRFCSDCWTGCRDLEYCVACHQGTAQCFGSVGLKRQRYCILNKQYSKAEYEAMIPRIRRHMSSTGEYGRFFPPFMSPYAHNASEASDYFPIDQQSAESLGYRWRPEEPIADAPMVFVPDTVSELSEDAAGKTYRCGTTGKPYRLLKQEIEFYRTHAIPPPKIAPLERIRARLAFYRIPELSNVACTGCGESVIAIAPHVHRGRVLCSDCFQEQLGSGTRNMEQAKGGS